MKIREAIILAGGKGTRLRSVINNLPKPLSPINNIPFLTYLILFLKNQGIERIILSVGYKWEMIKEVYNNEFHGIEIDYSIEDTPLGTGGGIVKALKQVEDNDVLILNGDSFTKIDILEFADFHFSNSSSLSIAIKEMHDFNRYGSIEIKDNIITSFKEKQFIDKGYINTGVYMIRNNIFSSLILADKFSFEEDFLCNEVDKGKFYGYKTNGYFIDIGIPEDYIRAEKELLNEVNLRKYGY